MSDPTFKVEIAEYKESHRTTYWVHLINLKTRPANPTIFDKKGLISPDYFENRDHAVHTAKEWATFLGVDAPEPCSCRLCGLDEWTAVRRVSRTD